MARFYDIDAANGTLPEVERILLDLRDQRAELIRLRDAVVGAPSRNREGPAPGPPVGGPAAPAPVGNPATADETHRIRLRMQGLIDQMQAGVTRLVEREITLREIEAGLIDFPALANGRQIWLCWRLGEGDVEWWHELDEGFAGRRRLADLT
jgi:hypothetical protein